ncbi:GNAT family N-acetyltransferase [Natronomonas sp. EA1]|uniref:GNAT family N-acetyltransferase n=1 Tax=Natronomonas sp. EA1 TaxID=3421655 RepID=UPI003EBFF6A4
MDIRAYDSDSPTDTAGLWTLKEAFERELGSKNAEKSATYDEKLTDTYRERYLDWVARATDSEDCLLLAEHDGGVVGYAFMLPESMAMIWDAAVLNEIYVVPDHRGTGLAGELLEAGLDHARSQDLPLDRVVFDVDPDNERAYAFYGKFGFETWAEMVSRDL